MTNQIFPLAFVPLSLAMITLSEAAPSLVRVEKSDFGKTRDGTAVQLVTLRNSTGMSAQIISYGAIIKELHAPDRGGKFANVVLTTDSIEKYERFPGSAAVIGRVVNRIANASFELDGKTYTLPANEGKNTIHGGPQGFAQAVWTVQDAPAKEGESAVSLTYLSKDGEQGFPGNLKTTVTYSLTDKNEFRIDYAATTDKPTIINLTNHAYWNLGGDGGSCLDNILQIPADSYTPSDAKLIPTGEILPVEGTPIDFRKPTRVGERISQLTPNRNGYDHNYVLPSGPDLSKNPDGGGTTSSPLQLAALLTDPKSGRTMEVRTTQPAVQLYTGNHLGNTAICLETQHFPDAVHHTNFPSIVLRPDQNFKETTVFIFGSR